ncbi:proteasome regulatory particle subunit [Coemansia sp. RSA 1807]|nr:proteasome regulatory particle subunit [Coemansia sp. RSA 2167]KAJ2126859.1 proteasome regulatory particle subunit [Coemansia sp. RSA 921]KAJ2154366.1 proteasome regulatory particle subunit [Coemansia sp. RSA 637]KAJ2280338.1 proteasome regulatory particle subunit [Coemansia sp. RSA 451]KAJ2526872.1 proteasome regulatory particle subunit [Coemansia sp. RSA 1937]KAJ2555338.1 proteasome regulatory particle subunit [Coemansia sp. RSA 1878]KAJ2576434.1 proteasome regulatory particle subunit [C
MDLDQTTTEPKMEKDYSESVKALQPEVEQLLASGQLRAALDKLHGLEKKTRAAADLWSTSQLLESMVDACGAASEWVMLEQEVAAMSKKHGQLKQAIAKMVQRAMTYVDKTPDEQSRIELIDALRTVTEGKIHVEVERARLTRMRVAVYEAHGQITEACDTLQEIQVETYGSMDRREKTDFILEQMRLCLAKRDYIRLAIISHKINPKYFQRDDTEDLKLRFYELMIQYDLHEGNYLEVSRHYNQIYTTKSISEDAAKWPGVLQNILLYLVLSPFDNEQSDMLHRVQRDHNLEKLELCTRLAKGFTTMELTRWPAVESVYGPEFRKTDVFSAQTDDGAARWMTLRDRVIEHNIRVIAKYYTRATITRLTELLDLGADDVEAFLSRAVVAGTIYARVDRPAGAVSFAKPREGEEQLNAWASDVGKLLGLVEKTTHLIAKEEIVNKIARAI